MHRYRQDIIVDIVKCTMWDYELLPLPNIKMEKVRASSMSLIQYVSLYWQIKYYTKNPSLSTVENHHSSLSVPQVAELQIGASFPCTCRGFPSSTVLYLERMVFITKIRPPHNHKQHGVLAAVSSSYLLTQPLETSTAITTVWDDSSSSRKGSGNQPSMDWEYMSINLSHECRNWDWDFLFWKYITWNFGTVRSLLFPLEVW